jgi:hypothetical protein
METDLSVHDKSLQFLQFKYSTLERATDCFNEAHKLGQGGYGEVFKVYMLCVREVFFNVFSTWDSTLTTIMKLNREPYQMVEKSRLSVCMLVERGVQMRYTMKWISLGEPSIRTWFVSWVAASPTSIASLFMNSLQTKALIVSYSVTTSISTIFSHE